MRVSYQKFTVTPGQNADTDPGTLRLDDNVQKVIGVAVVPNLPNQGYYRGSQRLEINGQEIYPSGYPTRLLMTSISVAPNEQYNDIEGDVDANLNIINKGLASGNKIVRIKYTDVDHPSAAFSAYTVDYVFKVLVNN